MSVIRERVDRLEEALMRLVYIQQKTEIELQNFKEEMKAFREGINEYKEWSKKHIENIQKEIKDFKEEMNEFKNWSKQHIEKSDREMQEFREWTKQHIEKSEMAMQEFRSMMTEFKEWSQKQLESNQKAMEQFRKEMGEYKEWTKKQIEKGDQEMQAFAEWTKKQMEKSDREMQEFREWTKQHIEKSERETQAFVEWSKKQIDSLNQAWGNLANRMGTLVEDIFAPSIDIALSKYFQAVPDVIDTRKKVRINGSSLEIDILAVERKKKRAFIVEIKGSPDRGEYVESFLEKLERVPRFLPELTDFQRIGIYAALNMQEETVKLLTRKGLYAMVFRGNVLEIVNFQDLQEYRSS